MSFQQNKKQNKHKTYVHEVQSLNAVDKTTENTHIKSYRKPRRQIGKYRKRVILWMSFFGHTEIEYFWDSNDEVRPLSS